MLKEFINFNKKGKEYQKCFSDKKFQLFLAYNTNQTPEKMFCIFNNYSSTGVGKAIKGTLDNYIFGEVDNYLYFSEKELPIEEQNEIILDFMTRIIELPFNERSFIEKVFFK